jgi:hypothetical protein
MYGFDFFKYICVQQCVISSHVYVISLFTCVIVFILKVVKRCDFEHNES